MIYTLVRFFNESSFSCNRSRKFSRSFSTFCKRRIISDPIFLNFLCVSRSRSIRCCSLSYASCSALKIFSNTSQSSVHANVFSKKSASPSFIFEHKNEDD